MQDSKIASKPKSKNSKCSYSPQADIIYPEEFKCAMITRIVKLSENYERSLELKTTLKPQKFSNPKNPLYIPTMEAALSTENFFTLKKRRQLIK